MVRVTLTIGAVCALGSASAQGIVEKVSNPGGGAEFSQAMAADGGRLAVGVGSDGAGVVHVYEHDGTNWGWITSLSASGAQPGDKLGADVALEGDVLIAAAPGAQTMRGTGAAYVFEWDGASWHQACLIPDDPVVTLTAGNVGLSNGWAVVGDREASSGVGAAYVYKRESPDTWSYMDRLTGSGAGNFGEAVEMDGDLLLIGAPNSNGQAGRAYPFQLNSGSWQSLPTQAHFVASGVVGGDQFSEGGIAMSGGFAVIGAPQKNGGLGAAYLYEFDSTAVMWNEVLEWTDGQGGFGLPAIDGDTAVVGAYLEDVVGADTGAAYVFERTMGGAWPASHDARLVACDAAHEDQYGRFPAIDGGRIIVGSPFDDDADTNAGSFYAYEEMEPTCLPSITSAAPSSGIVAGGNQVLVTGSCFSASTAVSFGGVPAVSVTFVSDTTLLAEVPALGGQVVLPPRAARFYAVVDVSVAQGPCETVLAGGYTYKVELRSRP